MNLVSNIMINEATENVTSPSASKKSSSPELESTKYDENDENTSFNSILDEKLNKNEDEIVASKGALKNGEEIFTPSLENPDKFSLDNSQINENNTTEELSDDILQSDGKILPHGQTLSTDKNLFTVAGAKTNSTSDINELSFNKDNYTESLFQKSINSSQIEKGLIKKNDFIADRTLGENSAGKGTDLNNFDALISNKFTLQNDSKEVDSRSLILDTLNQSSSSSSIQPSTIDIKSTSILTNIDAYKPIAQTNPLNSDASISLDIKSNMGSVDWNIQMGEKIQWMTKFDISTAKINLHPMELGALEIKIITEDDQTKVSFVATSQAAKEILETSMPKLRDMLNNNGLELENSDVSYNNNFENNKENQDQQQSKLLSNANNEALSAQNSIAINRHSNNQIDHYV